MLARLATAALVGLTAHPVGVEVDIGRGLPAVYGGRVGGTAVLGEARDARAAFGNTGYEWRPRRARACRSPRALCATPAACIPRSSAPATPLPRRRRRGRSIARRHPPDA